VGTVFRSQHKEHFVAESPDKSEKDGEDRPPAADPGSERRGAEQQVQIQIDDSRAVAAYANFCRITGTPEELIIDFGLNSQPLGVPTQPIPITLRIITNFFTAKRMLHALQISVQRHEASFGVLETDIRRRITPAAAGRLRSQPPEPPTNP
jgi:hypothetical protein